MTYQKVEFHYKNDQVPPEVAAKHAAEQQAYFDANFRVYGDECHQRVRREVAELRPHEAEQLRSVAELAHAKDLVITPTAIEFWIPSSNYSKFMSQWSHLKIWHKIIWEQPLRGRWRREK